jgi:hypothetical protein
MISLREAFTAIYRHYKRELAADVDFISGMLEYVNSGIALYMGEEPWRGTRMQYLSPVGSKNLHLPFIQPNHLVSVRYSLDQDFEDDDTEIPGKIIGSNLILETAYYGDDVIRVICDNGYMTIHYVTNEIPVMHPTATYSQPSDPALITGHTVVDTDVWYDTSTWRYYVRAGGTWVLHPEYVNLAEGDNWKHPTTKVIKTWTGSDWQEWPFRVYETPGYLRMAILEYLSWFSKRIAQGSVGIVKLERGYSFEGASIGSEADIPVSVRKVLDRAVGLSV